LSSRWGEIDDFGPLDGKSGPARVVVSLKALHLTDSEVLAGLAPALAGALEAKAPVRVVVARFYPPEQVWTAVLAEDLEIPARGRVFTHGGLSFEGKGGVILSPESPAGASLVISEYSTLPV
jgi:hypothetical protein